MKKFFLLIAFLFAAANFVTAQQASPTPQTVPNQAEGIRQMSQNRENNRRFEVLKNAGNLNPNLIGKISRENIEPLYRKPTGDELKLLAPNRSDIEKFAIFLRQPHTGLIKLAADFGCAENTGVVVASENCLRYTMPGAGSSYSFRTENYRIRRLADITFTDNSFQATGILLHGIFVNIGNVNLEQVSLNTPGIKFLEEFKPESDYQKAKELDLQISKGIVKDGFFYRRALEAQDNTTYALRSIAYKGNFFRAVQNISYDELAFDKRKDIIVVFRIVGRDDTGSVTILWKALREINSAKINTKLKKAETKTSHLTFH